MSHFILTIKLRNCKTYLYFIRDWLCRTMPLVWSQKQWKGQSRRKSKQQMVSLCSALIRINSFHKLHFNRQIYPFLESSLKWGTESKYSALILLRSIFLWTTLSFLFTLNEKHLCDYILRYWYIQKWFTGPLSFFWLM